MDEHRGQLIGASHDGAISDRDGHAGHQRRSVGSAPSIRWRRIAPATAAINTSLIFTSKAAAAAHDPVDGHRTEGNGPARVKATVGRRARRGERLRRRMLSMLAAAWARTVRATERAGRPTERVVPAGSPSRSATPVAIRWSAGGMDSAGGSPDGRRSSASGERSKSRASRSAAPMPSMIEWCSLATSATRPSCSPSTTTMSQGGRVRSSCREAKRPTKSSSCRSEPGPRSSWWLRWASRSK